MSEKNKPKDLLDWLCINNLCNFVVARPLGGVAAATLVLLYLLALAAAFKILCGAIFLEASDNTGNLGTGALVVALLGAPFLIWSTLIKHRTLVLSETVLFNDKINAALEALCSRRQITEVITKGDDESTLTKWEDDIVQRNGAIDRLEGLARERPSEVPRIAEMLSVYVRELSKTSAPPLDPDGVGVKALKVRTDIEKAVQTLGRLQDIPGVAYPLKIDLREANMQRFDMQGLHFAEANMRLARMEGTNLSNARMNRTNLSFAKFDSGTSWTNAQLDGVAARHADFRTTEISTDQIVSIFGDGSTETRHPPPIHWPTVKLDWPIFFAERDKWHKNPDTYIPPKP